MHSGGPRFDEPVVNGGYLWWYVDALSDDGQHGLTLIVFVGSVFSPYYAWARRRGPADPMNHCAINVALYASRGSLWAMTERPRGAVERSAAWLSIGPSRVRWNGDALVFDIAEMAAPLPQRIRGMVRITPLAIVQNRYLLAEEGRHQWRPWAPVARAEVSFFKPSIRWSGHAYCDSNAGDSPLEEAFAHWNWSRAALADGAAVLYDTQARSGIRKSLALRFDAQGNAVPFDPPPSVQLARTLWRVPRETRCEPGYAPTLQKSFEDAPFYARALIESRLCGETVRGVHESLNLDRFRRPWVKMLLPFRMPRASR